MLPFYIPPFLFDTFKNLNLKPVDGCYDDGNDFLSIVSDIIAEKRANGEDPISYSSNFSNVAYFDCNRQEEGTNDELYLILVPHARATQGQPWFAKCLCTGTDDLNRLLKNYSESILRNPDMYTSKYQPKKTFTYSPEMEKYGYINVAYKDTAQQVQDRTMIDIVQKFSSDKPLGVTFNHLVAEYVLAKNGFLGSQDDVNYINVDGWKDGGIDFIFFEYHGLIVNNAMQAYLLYRQLGSFDEVTVHIGQSKFYDSYNGLSVQQTLTSIDNFTEHDPFSEFSDKVESKHSIFNLFYENLVEDGILHIKPYFATCSATLKTDMNIITSFKMLQRNISRKASDIDMVLDDICYITESDIKNYTDAVSA